MENHENMKHIELHEKYILFDGESQETLRPSINKGHIRWFTAGRPTGLCSRSSILKGIHVGKCVMHLEGLR